MKIGELLISNGFISKEELDIALEYQKKIENKKRIGEILIEMEYVTIDVLLKCLDIQINRRNDNINLD